MNTRARVLWTHTAEHSTERCIPSICDTEQSPQVCAKFPIVGLLLGSSFLLDRIPGNHHLNKIEVPVHRVLEEDVWTTGHNISIRGDVDVPEDVCVMVLTNGQNFKFPPSRHHFKAIVSSEVIIDRWQSTIVPLHVEVEALGTALAENMLDSFNTLTRPTTVHIAYTTHAVCFEQASINAVVLGS